MSLLRKVLLAVVLLCAIPVWAAEGTPVSDEDANLQQMMNEGYRLVSSGKPQEAIIYFDKVAAAYEAKHRDSKAKIYCARTATESFKYLLLGASTKTETVVYSADWAYAYFMKGFALIDMGQTAEAKRQFEKALALSPDNSQFLSELGNVYQMEKDWPMALQTFRAAEAAASLSPPEAKNRELARAWRGIGYVLVEQNKLDEAEKIYRQCLDLDQNDVKAQGELRYVLDLKAKRSGL
jgi:tetratricopeptide (TPR) repeat protein